MQYALAALVVAASFFCGCAQEEPSPDLAEAVVKPTATRSEDPSDAHGRQDRQPTEHKYTNRLIDETSPYLLQHAHNPVDWYPWGEEAFEASRQQDKPIFLSVGYSTCYWCHVMERECFENEEIAALMNETCINIKVDREERPDVDDIYMSAVQITSGGAGGWPMSVFLEPRELKPFFGGTYYPPEPRHGRPSLPDLLRGVRQGWSDSRDQLLQQANYLAGLIAENLSQPIEGRSLNKNHVALAASQIMRGYDRDHGGFANPPAYAPKFPMPTHIDLLMTVDWENKTSRDAVLKTLDEMATGGVYDQVGGGFHRYSTDRTWLVPHFEKMLYDNGQLASTYAAAHERTGDLYYARIVSETLDYVLREMTDDAGGFYSAQDAEVDAREGLNYLWQPQQVREALSEAGLSDDVELVVAAFGLNQPANFRDPHHPSEPMQHILFLTGRPEEVAEELDLEVEEFCRRLDRAKTILLSRRDARKQPGLDDKIIASWNGLMIAGFADGGRALGKEEYIHSAARAAAFIMTDMRAEDGGLLRTHRAGKANVDAFLEDYAMMIHGLLALHRAGGDDKWLDAAIELADIAKARFWDHDHGGYYDTLAGRSDLFVRSRSTHDGALPCGMSVMANNLLTLHKRTGEEKYRDDAAATLRSMSAALASSPASSAVAAAALDRFLREHSAEPLQVEAGGLVAESEIVTITFAENFIEADTGPSAALDMTLTIAPGWHIVAHEPGQDSLVPLRVELIETEGYTLDVQYPGFETFNGPAGAMNVLSGSVPVTLRITPTGDAAGNPQLVVTYQACDDTKCLAPQQRVISLSFNEGSGE